MSEYAAKCLSCTWEASGSFANTNRLLTEHRDATDHAVKMNKEESPNAEW